MENAMNTQLRCKPGDLAVVVRTGPNMRCFLGKIIRVKEVVWFTSTPSWITDPPMLIDGKPLLFNDFCLRPVRGDELPACFVPRELEAA